MVDQLERLAREQDEVATTELRPCNTPVCKLHSRDLELVRGSRLLIAIVYTYSLRQHGSRRQRAGLHYLVARELRVGGRQICTGGQCVMDQSRRGMHCRGGIYRLRSRQVVVMRL